MKGLTARQCHSYLTLLDIDVGRYAAGWGRIKYVNDQLAVYESNKVLPEEFHIPKWDDDNHKVRDYKNYFEALEERGVYFSYPMDLDFTMLLSYGKAYDVAEEEPEESTIDAVLGKKHHDSKQYDDKERKLFSTYHRRFKLGSKPAAHINALSKLNDKELLANIPAPLTRLADAVISKLAESPE